MIESLFDDAFYREKYEDVAEAIGRGAMESGLKHYLDFGAREGRDPFRFESGWYESRYPLVAQEIRAGHATNALDHFVRIGRFRGYLPFEGANRPKIPSRFHSEFGGFWTDLTNAADLVEGKLECGLITALQAERLRTWIRNGYVILEKAVPDRLLELADADLRRAYEGGVPGLKFECHSLSPNHLAWQPEVANFAAKALDLHWLSQATTDLVFCPAILEFLGLVFERRPLASQSLGFLRGSAQPAHQDSAYVAYTAAMQFAASWIALEDVEAGAGELYYFDGSHRFDEYLYGGRHKSVSEANRLSPRREGYGREVDEHVALLPQHAERRTAKERTFLAKRGDVLIWSADLAHGGKPVSPTRTRRSVVTHYCPKDVVPLFAEKGRTIPVRQHFSGAWATTSHYE